MPEERLSFCMVTTFYPPYHFGGEAMYAYRLSQRAGPAGPQGDGRPLRRCVPRAAQIATPQRVPAASGRRDTPSARAVGSGRRLSAVLSLWAASVLRVRACVDIFVTSTSMSSTSITSRSSAGPACCATDAASSSTRRTSTGSSARCTCSWRYNREPCDRPALLSLHARVQAPAAALALHGLLERSVPHVDLFLSPSRSTIEAHRARGFTGADATAAALPTRERDWAGRGVEWRSPLLPLCGSPRAPERRAGAGRALPLVSDADLLIAGDGTYGA